MKIESGRGVAPNSSAKRAGAAAAPGFAPSVESAPKTSSVAPTQAATPLDALLALQSEEGPAQRRARQVKRGRQALDALERLEAALLSGVAPATIRAELEAAYRGRDGVGDEGLDALMLEIDTRLAVELAKLDMSRRPG